MILLGTSSQKDGQRQCLRKNVVGSESLSKCSAVGDIPSLRVMGEHLNTVSPASNNKDNLLHVSSFQQAYEALNDLTIPLSNDASGINSTDSSITDSATVDDKPITNIKKKKKKKKKGKRNLNISHSHVDLTGSIECDQHNRTSFQSSNLYNRSIDCDKNSHLVPPADNISVRTCERIGQCLKDATNRNRKIISRSICSERFELAGNFVHSDFRTSNGDTVICGGGLQEISSRGGEQETIENKIIMHCSNRCIEGLEGNSCLGGLPEYMSCETDCVMSATSEGSNGARPEKTQFRSQKSCFSDAYAVYPSRCDNVHFQSDVDKTRFQHDTQTGKENSHSLWQKNKKHYRDARVYGWKTSNHVYVPKDANSLVKYDCFSSNGLLSTPVVPTARHHSFTDRMKDMQGMYRRTHCNVLVESSQWIDQRRCYSRHSQADRQHETDMGMGYLKEKRSFLCKHDNLITSKKCAGDFKANMFRCHNKASLSQKEAFQIPGQPHRCNKRCFTQRGVNHNHWIQLDHSHCSQSYATSAYVQSNLPHTKRPGVLDCALFPSVQPYLSTKIPRTEHAYVDSLQASLDIVKRNPFCLGNRNSYEDNIRQDVPSRLSSQKWIPVGRKDSEVLKKIEVVYDCCSLKDVPESCNGNTDLHVEKIIPISFSAVDSEKTCLMSSHDKPKLITIESGTLQLDSMCKNIELDHKKEHARDYASSCKNSDGTPLQFIGSQMAMKALNAAYRLQIVSESIQLATGSPLAEFEKLLQLASPVISPSSALQHCGICLGNQLPYSSLCEHQLGNIPLRDLWDWYEKPGNYGLEVRAEDSKNLNGNDIDSVSFTAHFVPFLSAIQLFCHSQKSGCINSIGHLSSEISENGEGDKFFRAAISIDEPESLPGIISPSSCSNDMELIFEYFENDQPQQRKPLYNKVRDIKLRNFDHKVFGDPSMLDSMNLSKIHPASWYSVAWYPIYRIPEGNFRASFLTYHSLGFFQRCTPEPQNESQFCVVSPALGLQSYNAQGECWFHPKSSSAGDLPFNSSEFLKERLRTLEETAHILARGCVYKDKVRVTNRQPDYEFFLSRKRRGC